MLDCWGMLLGLKNELLLHATALRRCGAAGAAPEATVIEVYSNDVEQAMFLAAAHRMAELMGVAVFRIDLEEGTPQFILNFGGSIEEARDRIRAYYKARPDEVDLGHD